MKIVNCVSKLLVFCYLVSSCQIYKKPNKIETIQGDVGKEKRSANKRKSAVKPIFDGVFFYIEIEQKAPWHRLYRFEEYLLYGRPQNVKLHEIDSQVVSIVKFVENIDDAGRDNFYTSIVISKINSYETVSKILSHEEFKKLYNLISKSFLYSKAGARELEAMNNDYEIWGYGNQKYAQPIKKANFNSR